MGSGASKDVVGVPVNPRVAYSQQLSKKENTKHQIDAPVLVHMQHGSVRYREDPEDVTAGNHREIPHQGTDHLDQKKHYFYHTRLSHYGSDADKSAEEPFKFFYVTKGPARAQNKKLYYVYGQGLQAQDSPKVTPSTTLTRRQDFAWPQRCGPNDVMYSITITGATPLEGADNDWEEVQMLEDLKSTPDRSQIQLKAKSDDRVSSVKARMALKLLKAASSIFICHNEAWLRSEDILGDLRPPDDRSPAVLDILLTLM